ncbi:UDP-3-O-(3-hydroxymyristoyl)glucosamine N-acyltransferase [Cephaloticoccus capnophilus]|uniref:UDP-3-O-acylglucosamine N-acyltransferase n=1 Tax=Cephaloticoccus capnophilus TaxID=1548208 RepID=A0A139SJ02_9BACT|nr:UDP-3-O-(3-hydroxymyristoyl)glucosamine N-acyltransferase [Cephaloticoccus capnophilus]KXU34516.1 UDP-3-O-(3-hydroxymyristoyl)glucosamine N-acyltransferase [Cephaloticoccus capnophilus]
MSISLTPEELRAITGATRTSGQTHATITGIASLEAAEAGDLSFLGNAKYRTAVPSSRASLILLPEDYEGSEPGEGQCYFFVKNPSAALASICSRIEQSLWPKPQAGVHPTAVVEAGAEIDPTATVGPLCVVEEGARIGARTHLQAQVFVGAGAQVGDDCWLMPHSAVSAQCTLGNRVRLHPGAVIGADGFGYEFVEGRHEKIPQVGTVVLEDDVEVGANSTIDRARFSQTRVGEGTKIDNLVQVGHNVVIGKHCILCSQVGIAGSATLEDYVILGGQVGVSGHLRIGKAAKAGGQAGVIADVEPGAFISGYPAMPHRLASRLQVLQRRLPDLFKRVDQLEQQLAQT